ncbi:MAG: hypothetical protein A2787_04760 [Omnitrophica WOR_2 bacterium RIFCSPHIGHO2_01_FULL_48_9]|nr:MAG: hypothetical protein A2787_04760 [Omnitrophica WOR_2 bacterium RIFCSPHIGHO2_01_FULL_48_9]
MSPFIIAIFLIIPVTFFGCAGIETPALTPQQNVQHAAALLKDGQPLPAERLLAITMNQSQEKNDEAGLALAYETYAEFLQSPMVAQWERYYRNNGFVDSSVTFDNRNEKSRDYWHRAVELYVKNAAYGQAADVYLNLATLEVFNFKNRRRACENFTLSLENNKKFTESHPGEAVIPPPGYATLEDYIAASRKQLLCK